jgi:ABC-type transport system involved in multi-copper enzyme maturation permease subunit
MNSRISTIGFNTFREAVRDRVLYNLIFFALLLVAAAPLFGQISVSIERIFLINLGLTAISIFGIVIAIFIGIGLVSKEIEKRTLYTVLSRPVRRWEFITGKYLGLAGTLVVNTLFMTTGFYAALLFLSRHFGKADANILTAIYFIVLQFFILTSLALLFSSFSSPVLSAVFSFAMFIAGSFAEDLRGFAAMTHGPEGWLARVASYVVPNLGTLNVITRVSHDQIIPASLIASNTAYSLLYVLATLSAAILIFEFRDLK